MKKIILTLLTSLLFSMSYAQQLSTYTESFSAGIPTTWAVFDNGTGTDQSWHITSVSANVYSPDNSAEVNRENIGAGNTSEDWLVTDLQTIAAKTQFRFYARSSLDGDRGTQYQIRVSETSQTDPSKFTIIKSYNSLELSDPATIYKEKTIDLTPYNGKNIYIAFVRVFAQPTNTTSGDKWLLDNVRIVPECLVPVSPGATNITASSATLSWVGTAPQYDVAYGTKLDFETGNEKIIPDVNTGVTITGLEELTEYFFFVKSICDGDVESEWNIPFTFTTRNIGSVCATPYIIGALPYEVKADNTGLYGNDVKTWQGNGCGAIPSSFNYLAGNDVFYSYTPTENGFMSISMTPLNSTSTNSSIFVYGQCADIGTANCLGGSANAAPIERIVNLPVTAGQTYIIVISSSSATPSIDYKLLIQSESCTPMPTVLGAEDITLNSAKLTWTSTEYTSWEVAVQPFGAAIPSGSGVATTSNPYPAENLLPATLYQYWVRAECVPGSKTFTGWAGPYVFNTLICEATNTCTYTFSMTDSANNGWNGAQMQVRQNGIVVQTIGSTYISGAGPVNIPVQLCDGVPFDLYWSVAGSQPQQCIVAVVNSFGQTIYTKAAGTGAQGEVVYASTVDCTTKLCNIAPTGTIATSILTTTANIGWIAPATSAWEIYLVPTGTAPPTATTDPTYTNVNTNPWPVSALEADHTYDVYLRVQCSPEPSPWSTVYTFTTLPTCPKPTPLKVNTTTTTTATLEWTNGTVGDTEWEILLIAATDYIVPPPPAVIPILGPKDKLYENITAPSPFLATGLEPATIYYYYIRTVCPGNDKSIWSGPIPFNTLTCDAANKCVYRFILRDSGSNGWQGARMQVRQNGILISTLGANMTGGGPTTVSVSLCNNVPFDLFWNIAGSNPEEVEISIQNPYTDLIYNKPAGVGSPNTVLFNSVGNCTPPTCPKPTALQVANVTSNSVELSWTENGSASKWEVYVVPVGSSIPVNGSPVSGVPPYYIADTNLLFKVSGLLPSTNYIYYVRAICSDTDASTWTIISPKTFTTKPANDNCDMATTVIANPDKTCTNIVSGSTLGASASTPTTNCIGIADDDVWFKFDAVSAIQTIELKNIVGSTTNLNHVFYSGNDCASLTQVYCSDLDRSTAFNLTVGSTYWIRVYTAGSISTDSTTFDVCITTPPPIENDECSTAIAVIPNINLKCENYNLGSVTGATASLETNTCLGTADDDVWYSFVANSEFEYIELNTFGEKVDLNHAVYTGECGNLTLKYCSAPGSLVSSSGTFLKNKTYYIRVWSNSSAPQDIVFGVCVGTTLPPITTSVTDYTYQQLVEDLLLKTKCVSVTNVKGSTGINFGSVDGIGSFDASESDFPFKDGVILSSGDALSAPGPKFGIQSAGGFSSWGGDAELDEIIYAATSTNMASQNASVLEFDFIPFINKMKFNFLFASEEYGNFQCAFSDAFAFILTDLTVNGPAINLAVVPNTSPLAPISVVTIRDDKYNSGCASKNPSYFGDFYGNADGVNYDPTHEAPINFAGTTIPMTASSDLIPGHKYHIKMVVADNYDTSWDSAVFIEGKSFDLGGVNLGPDLVGKNSLCGGTSTTLNSGLDIANYTFTWEENGVIIPGADGSTLKIDAPGNYTVNASFKNATCTDSDSILVEYFADIVPGVPNNLVVCNGTGFATFDLTQNTPVLLSPYPNDDHAAVYFTSEADANLNTNPIPTPAAYQNTSNPQIIYARVNDLVTGCYVVVTFEINSQVKPPQFTLSGAMAICPDASTTITVVPTSNDFDLNVATYTWTYNANVLQNETSSSLTIIKGSLGYGTYTVTVNNEGCTATQTFDITNSNTVWNFAITAPEYLCADETGIISVNVTDNTTGTPATYTYTLPDLTTIVSLNNTLTVNEPGTYTVNVNILGCENSQSVTIKDDNSDIAIGFEEGCNSNDYQLIAIPIDNSFDPSTTTYVWSGPSFDTTSNANTITLKTAGTYTVTITTDNTCKATQSITVNSIACTIQKGISPNNDGLNDYFDLSSLDVKYLSIFNRYGKKVYDKSNYSNQWYGTTNDGKALPDGTYYYVIEREGVSSVTGWIYVIHQH